MGDVALHMVASACNYAGLCFTGGVKNRRKNLCSGFFANFGYVPLASSIVRVVFLQNRFDSRGGIAAILEVCQSLHVNKLPPSF